MGEFDKYNWTAVYEQTADGRYRAFIEEIDGVEAYGDSIRDAEYNLCQTLKVLEMVKKRQKWRQETEEN